ncbi:MAG: dihydrolipoamide acetyltransferase family protein [Halobacteriaceae archaeon]
MTRHEFRLPDVGEGVAEGELVEWLVAEGDTVTEDQAVAKVETDKAVVDVPSPYDGTVAELHWEPGDVVPVGDVFVTFETDGEVEGTAPETEAPADTDSDAAEEEAGAGTDEATDRVFAAPRVRRRARELGVDLDSVEGTGPSGRVTEADVEAAAEGETEPEPEEPAAEPASAPADTADTTRDRTLAAPATRRRAAELDVDLDAVPMVEERDGQPYVTTEAVEEYADAQEAAQAADVEAVETGGDREEERVPYRGVRRTVGEQMERSKFTAPHVTHHDTVVVEDLVEWRADLKDRVAESDVRLTYLPFVMKAVVAALEEFPYLNSQLDADAEEIVLKHYYDIGVAVATDAGLMVPVVRDVGEKGILELAAESQELADRARDRSISREEMQGSTFSITNFGAIGGEYATPILNYPEVAILGLGAIEDRPVVEDGEVVARKTLPLSLTIDHRVVDGAVAAAFVNRVKEYLADPRLLVLE